MLRVADGRDPPSRSPRYENQAIRFGRVAYGIQCHLETSREDLEAQGAYAAAASALERAARLTSDPDRRAERLLGAAQCAHQAGHVHAALDQLGEALEWVSSPALRIELEHARGRIAARSGEAARARDWLTATAERCEHDEPARAAEILADAILPALRGGSPAEAVGLARRAMRRAQGAGDRVEIPVTLRLGMALIFAGDYDEGVALIDHADATGAHHRADAAGSQPYPYLGAALALAGRYARAREVLARMIAEARNAGAADMLPYALVRLAGVELDTGRWRVAAAALAEAVQLAEETGNSADHGLALGTLAWLEAAQGRAGACRARAEEALELAGRHGSGARLDRAAAALGLLDLACGRPESAIAHFENVRRLQQEGGWSDAARTPHRLPDLVEAYALAGRDGEAQAALDEFSRDAERTRRPLGARPRGPLSRAPGTRFRARRTLRGRPGAERGDNRAFRTRTHRAVIRIEADRGRARRRGNRSLLDGAGGLRRARRRGMGRARARGHRGHGSRGAACTDQQAGAPDAAALGPERSPDAEVSPPAMA